MSDEIKKQEPAPEPEREEEPTEADSGAAEVNAVPEKLKEEKDAAEASAIPSYLKEEKVTLKDFRQHLGGPVISILLHIVILLVAGTAILFDPPPKNVQEDVTVEMKEVEMKPLPPPPEQEVQQVDVNTEMANEFTDVQQARPDVAPTQIQNVSEPVASANTDFGSQMDIVPTIPVLEASKSKLVLRGAFAVRSGEGRKLAIRRHGGSARTESAVTRALDWLVSVQNEDGSWGEEDDQYNQKVQLTCLALLAFLAHGESPQAEKYGPAIMKGLTKAMEWVRTRRHEKGVDENGNIKWEWNDWYAESRLTIVMAEGYAITKIPALERAMNMSVERIIKQQNVIGGFYSWKNPKTGDWVHRSDLDLGSRMYNALYSASNAGCTVEGMETAIERSISAIEKHHAVDTGGFSAGMTKEGKGVPTFDASGAGTLYLYLMGSKSKTAEKGMKFLINFKPNKEENSQLKMDWKNLPSQTSSLGWYYMTQALFQATGGAGEYWLKWNKSMVKTLCSEQTSKGFWECPADKYPRKEEKLVDGKKIKVDKIYNESGMGGFTELNGRLWATVYFTLSLEVYYRYLPTFQPDGTRTPMDLSDSSSGGTDDSAKPETPENELDLGD